MREILFNEINLILYINVVLDNRLIKLRNVKVTMKTRLSKRYVYDIKELRN